MRKLILAALLALTLVFAPVEGSGGAAAQTNVTLTQGEPADLAPPKVKYNRFAKVLVKKTEELYKDFGEHNDNPFASKEDCVAGLEEDTVTIYTYLLQTGVDIEGLDVIVECKPAGEGA